MLIMSPDTDIYHIALPMDHDNKDISIQISKFNCKELRFMHLTAFLSVTRNDPDLASLPPHQIPQVLQTLFVVTGCDYVSFFSGIGKATLLCCFYKYAEFISSGLGNAPGTLADVNLEQDSFNTGFLAFLRLVGVVYFKKHALTFSTTTPVTHFNTFNEYRIPLEQHYNWLDDIRQNIWDRTLFENYMIPSTDALYRHWKRGCWVINM